jgi:hypothetical protein
LQRKKNNKNQKKPCNHKRKYKTVIAYILVNTPAAGIGTQIFMIIMINDDLSAEIIPVMKICVLKQVNLQVKLRPIA